MPMSWKDFQKRPEFLLWRALPPFVFSCVALWFFCFLFQHAAPRGSQYSDTVADSGKQSTDVTLTLNRQKAYMSKIDPTCDLARGRWIRDSQRRAPYDEKCRDIFKGWNCIRNNKSNAAEILSWRWQPWQCDLPQMDAALFLEKMRNKRIGFVGDSLNRNMYVSLVCSLKQVSSQVKKWRPAGADKAVTFLDYNVTLAYHRTNLLARYGQWEAKQEGGKLESLGYKQGYKVDVDIPQSTWAEAPSFHDILILNSGGGHRRSLTL